MSEYNFWFEALKDPLKIGKELPVHENLPQSGFYRMRAQDPKADMIPVAIWNDGKTVKVGNKLSDSPSDIWSFCCRYPVTEEAYHTAIDGEGWADSPPENDRAVKGDNLPDDPFEALKQELLGEEEIAAELLKKPVETEEQADKVANLSKRIASFGKKADELFAIEKRPVIDEGKRIDDKFRDLRDKPKSLTRKLKDHIDAYLRRERDKELKRQQEAAREAEQKRKEAEEAAKAAENTFANPNDPEADALKEAAAAAAEEAARAEKEAELRSVSAGRTGSKVSLRTIKSANIIDYDVLLMALKDRVEVIEVVKSLANRAAKSDIELPGMKIITDQKAV